MPAHAATMERATDSLSREERVRLRAQELYLLRDGQPGSAVDDWLRAEEEIRAEQAVDEALEASFPASDPPAHPGDYVAQVIIPDRDPRIDPQRGDTVRGNGQVRRVMAREGDRVRCASGEYDYRMRLDSWQKWCRLTGAAVQVAAFSRDARKATAA